MSGEVDYLLRVVVPDIAAYDTFYKKLISRIEISKVSSAFAMEQIEYTTALPLDFALRHGNGEEALTRAPCAWARRQAAPCAEPATSKGGPAPMANPLEDPHVASQGRSRP